MSPYNPYTNITNAHTVYTRNWASYRQPQCSVSSPLMPAMYSYTPMHAQIYRHTSAVLPPRPFVLRKCETVNKCHTYAACIPQGIYFPQNEQYTQEISASNASELSHSESDKEYHIKYETGDNNINNYSHSANTSATDEKMDTTNNSKEAINDPLDFYLTLPKELFPSPKNFLINPNPIIDEFCKLPSIENHAPWILDLEFGIRKESTNRAIPMYNVKLNSINCMGNPNIVHPEFEKCSPDFKRVFLFYYDSIVSTWYKGYIVLSGDSSVDNFQSWLSLPIQVLGMCWS